MTEFLAVSGNAPTMVSGAVTHVGGVRKTNEDSFFVDERICLVADGMGGHEAGEVASGLVVDLFEKEARQEPIELAEMEPLLSLINDAIRTTGDENGTVGMGTTVVGVAVISNGDGDSAVVFNVGDSRCYRLVGGELEQVTVDHSYVQEMIDAGEIEPDEAATHPMRNVVTRALGVDDNVRADYTVLEETDCRLLLCSDGLSGEADIEDIATILREESDPQSAALRLVEAVLSGRAPDNVTAVVVDLTFRSTAPEDDTVPNAVFLVDEVEITAPRAFPPPERSGVQRQPMPIVEELP